MLQAHIEHYWFVLDEAGEPVDLRVEVFVDARADLIFNFEAPYRREVIGGPAEELADSNFDAQRLVPIRIEQRGQVRVGGVRFQLGGVAAFTKVHLAEFTGLTPRPGAVFGVGSEALEAALRHKRDPDAATELLDAFFLELLEHHGPHPAWAPALGVMRSSDGLAPLAEVADAAGVSVRHLERLFARGLGLPPKTVARVLRFQHALRRLMGDPAVPLGELAATAGYFDQPHFIREFW
jgi:AraC-like DNA-binding protein